MTDERYQALKVHSDFLEAAFRPVSVTLNPDGSVCVSSWWSSWYCDPGSKAAESYRRRYPNGLNVRARE